MKRIATVGATFLVAAILGSIIFAGVGMTDVRPWCDWSNPVVDMICDDPSCKIGPPHGLYRCGVDRDGYPCQCVKDRCVHYCDEIPDDPDDPVLD